MEVKIALTLFIILAAVILDLQTGRISNKLILTGYLIGLLYKLLELGVLGGLYFLINLAFPIVLLFLLFVTRTLGAGDIKLFSVICGIWNIRITFLCMAASFIVAAAFCLCKLLYQHNLIARLIFFAAYIKEMIQERTLKRYKYDSTNTQYVIHFSIPILVGYLIVLEVVY